MQIVILNKRDGHKHDPENGHFSVDRSSPLGNPFELDNEDQRDNVCDLYDKHFHSGMLLETKVLDYLTKIQYHLITHGVVYLLCWCAPLRCHGNAIRDHLMLLNGFK